MRTSVTRTLWQCDVCGSEIGVVVFKRISVKGHAWDLCEHCASKLVPSLMFLGQVFGDDLKYDIAFVSKEEGNDE